MERKQEIQDSSHEENNGCEDDNGKQYFFS